MDIGGFDVEGTLDDLIDALNNGCLTGEVSQVLNKLVVRGVEGTKAACDCGKVAGGLVEEAIPFFLSIVRDRRALSGLKR